MMLSLEHDPKILAYAQPTIDCRQLKLQAHSPSRDLKWPQAVDSHARKRDLARIQAMHACDQLEEC
jgi:hypothetical protein